MDLQKDTLEALSSHPDFKDLDHRFFLGKWVGLGPREQARNLLSITLESGPHEAVAWYRRAASIRKTPMRIVGKVYGLSVGKVYELSNGFKLLPVGLLPDSPNSRYLKEDFARPLSTGLYSAIMYEVDDVTAEEPQFGSEQFSRITDPMRRIVNAIVLAGEGSPILAECWSEFVDPDLNRALIGHSWQSSGTDGTKPSTFINMSDDMAEWIERYIRSSDAVRASLDVGLARLNIAIRRLSPGDKAIDGCICLESLFSKDLGGGGLRHGVALRTALLLGKSLDERRAIAKQVREFYDVRSKVVHGSKDVKAQKSNAVVDHGLEYCREALRSILLSGELPQPDAWELTGGPLWNKFEWN